MKEAREGRLTTYCKQCAPFRWGLAALLSFGGACAFPWMLQLPSDSLIYTNSITTVFLCLALLFLIEKILRTSFTHKKAGWLLPGIFSLLFCTCMVFGTQLEMHECVPFGRADLWLAIFMLSVLVAFIVRYLWEQMQMFMAASKAETTATAFSIRGWFKRALIIFICFFPVFLAVYPGFFVYDAQDEYMQVVTRSFSTHHPLIHVLLLGGIIQLGYKLSGYYNVGIACYTVFQMILMSGIFAWCIEKLRNRGLASWKGNLLTAYFGLCPVLVMFSLCSAKDGLFTGMLLIQVILLQELCAEPEQFLNSKGRLSMFGIASLGMMMLRHNGFYAFLVFVPVMMIYLKGFWKKALPYFLIIIVSYFLVNSGLTALLHADASEHQEKLTVPIMQMARVYAYEQESLTALDKEQMTKYLPAQAWQRYTPKVSDGVKISFDNAAYEADKSSFWSLWARLGVQHPFAYLNAWFMTSYGFWYPDTVIDSYTGNTVFTYTYEDSSYFGYEVEQPGTRQSLWPALDEAYRRLSLELTQQKVPVISMLFAPGFLFWILFFMMGFWCYTRRFREVIPFVLPLLCFLTVLLGPTCLVRYVVFLWVLVPLMAECRN